MANILIFARELAPYCNSVGSSLRVLTLANYLKRQGHNIKFVAAKGVFVSDFGLSEEIKNIDAIYLNDALQKYYTKKAVDLNAGLEKKNFFQKYFLKIALEKIKSYSIPDVGIYFLPKFIKFCLKIIKNEEIEYLIVSSPPHSSQILGLIIKLIKNKKIKLIVDYRDGWNSFGIFAPKNIVLLHISKTLEAAVLKKCDFFLYQSATVLKKLKLIYPNLSELLSKKSILVRNGYTELGGENEDPTKVKYNHPIKAGKINTIGYFGGLDFEADSFRNPSIFLKYLDSLGMQIIIRSYGALYGVEKMPKFINLKFEILGMVSLAAAKEEMKKCDALFVFHASNDGGEEVIPGKFYEYVEAQKPILVYGPKGMECGKIVEEEGFGLFIPLGCTTVDIASLKKFICSGYALLNNGKKVMEYSRNAQYKKIEEILI